MFFMFFYFVLPHWATSHHKYWICQTICKAKPIKFIITLYTDHNTLESILYKLVSTATLLAHTINDAISSNKNRSSTSVNFHLPIPPSLVVHKIILIISTNTPFLYTSAIFHLPLFAYNHPKNCPQNICSNSIISPI